MSYSSYTFTTTFTLTNAKYLASKIATDLKRMQRFYGKPSDSDIENYESEVIQLLNNGYLDTITYGFKKNDKWIEPTIKFTAQQLSAGLDDDPGRLSLYADITGAQFYNYLTYSDKWDKLSSDEKDKFKKSLPFYRTGASEPEINGYWSNDKTYSSGGVTLNRCTIKDF